MSTLQKGIALWVVLEMLTLGAGARAAFSAQDKGTSIDLNTASEKELVSLPGVGPATAKKIIAGRPYSSVNDLSKAGVSAATIKKITPLVAVSGGTAAAASESKRNANIKEAQPQSSPESPSPPPKTTSAATSQGTPGPGTVWVNLDSGIYHRSGTRYYGKTKNGKYMSEADAVKAGYHAAKNETKPQQ